MEETKEYIELPIDLETHSWFMNVVERFDVEIKIESGKYKLFYNNPEDLFKIGIQVSRCPNKDFYTSYGLPK